MKRIAFYGGSFDPVHNGHLAIGRAVLEQFELDEFVFLPAFHAPHKLRTKPTSAFDRHAMLCLATRNDERLEVSKLEIEAGQPLFTVQTLTTLKAEMPDDEIYFVMGADSLMDITTWREWEEVLTMVDHIVITRPGVEIGFGHLTDEIRKRVVDLRGKAAGSVDSKGGAIYITDAVNMEVSATDIRRRIREGDPSWSGDVAAEVANYIEKYQIY